MENSQDNSTDSLDSLVIFFGGKIRITDSNLVSVEFTAVEGGEVLVRLFDYFSSELARSRKGSNR